jgi:TP901 family phage tail tape measure protein
VSQYNAAIMGAGRATHMAVGSIVNAAYNADRAIARTTTGIKSGFTEATGAVRKHSAELDRVGSGMLKTGAAIAVGLGLSVKAAMSWESAFAGVRKTVDELDPAFGSLESQLRSMARTMATSHEDIAAVAENAGALGVKTKDIAQFTRQMIILGETTNVTADEASTYMAQFMTIMGSSPQMVGRLSAALVDLGNNGASTEAQILEMSQRIAGAGRAVGLSEAEVMGFASAIASAGMNVEAGGSAISRVFTQLDRIVTTGGPKLQTISDLVGGDFAAAFKQDASGAVVTFIEALGRLQDQGGSITAVLDDIGIKNIYQTDVIRRLAGAHGLLAEQIGISEKATQDGTAALVEYGKRMETAESRAAVAWNTIKDQAIDAGQEMLPIVADAADGIAELMQTFQELPGPLKATAVNLAGVTAAALLLGGGALKAVVWGVKMVDTLRALEKTSPRTAAGFKKVAVAAALMTAATLAARAWGTAMEEQAALARTKGTDIAVALAEGLKDGAAKYDFGALLFDKQDNFLGIPINQIEGADALRRVYDPNVYERIKTSIEQLFMGTDAGARVRDSIGEIDKGLALLAQSGNAEAAAAGFREFSQFVTDSGIDMQQVIPDMKEYRQSLEQIAEGLGLQGQISEGEFVDWMGGKVPAAVREAVAAGGEFVDSLTDQQKQALGLDDALKTAIRSMREYSALALALSGSALGVQMAFDAGTAPGSWDRDAKGKKTGTISGGILSGGGFSTKSKAGQHNLGQIHDMAAAANAYLESLSDANADTETIITQTQKWRDALAEAYVEGGKNEDVAAALAATYIAMPEDISPTLSVPNATLTKKQVEEVDAALREIPEAAETEILAPGARPSKQEVSDFIDEIHDVPPETVAALETIAHLAGVRAAQDALDSIRDKTVNIRFKPVGSTSVAADGGLFSRRGNYTGPLMRAYADSGTTDLPPIGHQRPRIEHNRGERGIQWSETGAGPWEGFVSGHPGKRQRSRQVTEDIANRLGGDITWRAADGGVVMPSHNGQDLDYWQDALLSPLELTRLKIRIRDLKRDLKAKEKYGKGRKKKTRYKLRDLDRTEAKQELAEAQQELAEALEAAKLDKAKAGTIAARLEAYDKASEQARDAAGYADQIRAKATSGLSVTTGYQRRQDAAGNVWYSTGAKPSADALRAQAEKEADAVGALHGKVEALVRAGASKDLLEKLVQLDPEEAVKVADSFLANRDALARQNQAYADIGTWSEKIGKLVAAAPAAATTSSTAGSQSGTVTGARAGTTINITTINPAAEAPSVTMNKGLASAAAIGQEV